MRNSLLRVIIGTFVVQTEKNGTDLLKIKLSEKNQISEKSKHITYRRDVVYVTILLSLYLFCVEDWSYLSVRSFKYNKLNIGDNLWSGKRCHKTLLFVLKFWILTTSLNFNRSILKKFLNIWIGYINLTPLPFLLKKGVIIVNSYTSKLQANWNQNIVWFGRKIWTLLYQ